MLTHCLVKCPRLWIRSLSGIGAALVCSAHISSFHSPLGGGVSVMIGIVCQHGAESHGKSHSNRHPMDWHPGVSEHQDSSLLPACCLMLLSLCLCHDGLSAGDESCPSAALPQQQQEQQAVSRCSSHSDMQDGCARVGVPRSVVGVEG